MKNENNQILTKTILALAIGLAFSGHAVAQTSAQTVVDASAQQVAEDQKLAPVKTESAADAVSIVVLTGTRASLAKSLSIKRNADIVLDSISATELGRFPDDNVADSLSHINGVSITRTTGGEGQYVGVRGLGSQYNIVTVNNRVMATDDNGRDVAFDVFPSDVISGADVLKSAQASAIEGSIGGTVNLRTASPFDNPGFHSAFRAEENYNSMSYLKGGKFSAVISDTSEDRKFGAILGFVRSNTKLRTDSLNYNTYDANNPGNTLPINGIDQKVVAPCCIAFGSVFDEKKRDAISGAVEWRPNSEFKLVADMLVTKLDDPQIAYDQAYYPPWSEGTWSDLIVKNGFIDGMKVNNYNAEFVNSTVARVVKTSLFGLNGVWKPNPDLTLVGDIYRSKASRPEGGNDTFVVAGIGGNSALPGTGILNWSNNHSALPNLAVTLQDGRDLATSLAAHTLGNADFQPHYLALSGVNIEDKVTGGTLDGTYAIDKGFVDHLKFGLALTDRIKSRDDISNDWNNGSNQYSNLYGSNINFSQLGNNLVSITSLPNFMHGAGGKYTTSTVLFSVPAYLAGLKMLDGKPNTQPGVDPGTVYDLSKTLPALNKTNSYRVSEKTIAAYAEATMSGAKWNGNLGLRLIKTETESSTFTSNILSIYDPTPGVATSAPTVTYSDPIPTVTKSSYVKPLPSANFSYWVQPELQLRLGVAEVMARANLNQLAPTQTDGTINRVYEIYRSGNSAIKPITAFQQDLSLEWYYQPKSALTMALFSKQIKNFITTQTTNNVDIGVPGQLYSIQQPMNGDKGKIFGIELAIQHLFDNGFGVRAAYTNNQSKAYISGEYVGQLEGVSPSTASLGLLYEAGAIRANISWDYASSYVVNTTTAVPGMSNIADPFLWVTASASYEINKNIKLYVEGKNLSNAVYKSYLGGNHNEIYGYNAYGSAFKVGLALKF